MSIHLLISSDSYRNTTISCDSLGIHYEVSTHDGVISIKRWDSSTNANITVGEVQFRVFSKDQIKLGEYMVGEGEWCNIMDVLLKSDKTSFTRRFQGKDGKGYRWKRRWKLLVVCYSIFIAKWY